MLRHRGVFGGFGGADDRRIAGATAEVAGELVVMIGGVIGMGGDHRHDEAWGAKTALAAVEIDHCLLHRMQGAIRMSDAFDRAYGFAVELRQEQDAGVQRSGAALVGDHHGARAAIALVAAFLGAGETTVLAQPVQERCCWLGFWKRDLFTVEMKGNRHLEKPVAVPCCPMLRDFRCDVESARALFDVTLSL